MNMTWKAIRLITENIINVVGISNTFTSSPKLALKTWIYELRDIKNQPTRGHITILAIRNNTWIEWAVYTACWMRKLGYIPIILYSNQDAQTSFGRRGKQTFAQQLLLGDYIKSAATIPDSIWVNLDDEPKPTSDDISKYNNFAEDYAHTMAAYDLRLEEHEEGDHKGEYMQEVVKDKNILAEYGAMMEHVLRRLKKQYGVKRLIAYSGLIGVTSAVREAATRCEWEVAFCEGWAIKPGHMIVSHNTPALNFDIVKWLKALGQWDEGRINDIERFLAFQETCDLDKDTDWLKNYHRFQRSSASMVLSTELKTFLEGDGPLFLLAPNCVGDSATLRVQTIFKSQRDWVNEICRYFQAHPQLRLIIRAHPDELMYYQWNKIVIMMGDIAQQAAGNAPNIRVVKGHEDISTYALIPYAQAGLIWMSTVGVDIVVRNCPVLAAATPKYHGLGIVHEPQSREEYFNILDRLTDSQTGTSDKQKEMAKKYLTIIAKELSYKAFSTDYRGRNIRLNNHPIDGDCETFYRILAGDYPLATRPSSNNK